MEEKSFNSSPESKHDEQDTNQDDTATGPTGDESPPPFKLSGLEITSSSQVSPSPNSGNSSFTSFGKSPSASSKDEPSDNQIAGNSSHLAASGPLRPLPSDQCLRSRDEGRRICSSASESMQREIQTSGTNFVSEENNQDPTASVSNIEHPSSLPASESLQREPVPTAQTSGTNVVSGQNMNHPSHNLISNYESYSTKCLPLHMAALNGDVDEAIRLLHVNRLQLREAITYGDETVFHVAAGAKQIEFLEEMVRLLNEDVDPLELQLLNEDVDPLELQDKKGNTAFCYAVAAGTIPIAEIMLTKNRRLLTIRGFAGNTPLYIAALFGQKDMALFLYNKKSILTEDERRDILTEDDKKNIFFISIHSGVYDLAWELLNDDESLAVARDDNDMSALHLLANLPSAFACESPGPSKMLKNLLLSVVPGTNSTPHKSDLSPPALKLLNRLWSKILHRQYSNVMEFINEPRQLLFDAARIGNFKFLAELLRLYPRLVYELDEEDRSIFHVAVLHRHVAIFNLIYDIGFDKQFIASFEDKKGNNLLHLAAEYLSHKRAVDMVPGAALEMQQELILFKEVESLVMPTYREMKNSEGITPGELFTNQHAKLLEKGEKWMKRMATSCSVVATLIATVVFAAAFELPGGNFSSDANNGTPIHLKKSIFCVFAVAEAIALSFSSISILMFLSILTSRYREEDFLWSLPLKLVIGISALFISIVNMMLTFSSNFFLAYTRHRSNPIPIVITILVFVPVVIFVFSQFHLVIDVLCSSFRFRFSIKPRKGRRLK